MEKKEQKLGRGYISAACREVGVSTTVYRTAKKKKAEGSALTRAELAVLIKHRELTEEAQRQLKSL